ncbi:hypothetical protein ACFPRL_01305 [Pseudoclavibacter helvolus]
MPSTTWSRSAPRSKPRQRQNAATATTALSPDPTSTRRRRLPPFHARASSRGQKAELSWRSRQRHRRVVVGVLASSSAPGARSRGS